MWVEKKVEMKVLQTADWKVDQMVEPMVEMKVDLKADWTVGKRAVKMVV